MPGVGECLGRNGAGAKRRRSEAQGELGFLWKRGEDVGARCRGGKLLCFERGRAGGVDRSGRVDGICLGIGPAGRTFSAVMDVATPYVMVELRNARSPATVGTRRFHPADTPLD